MEAVVWVEEEAGTIESRCHRVRGQQQAAGKAAGSQGSAGAAVAQNLISIH